LIYRIVLGVVCQSVSASLTNRIESWDRFGCPHSRCRPAPQSCASVAQGIILGMSGGVMRRRISSVRTRASGLGGQIVKIGERFSWIA
jgi:hypothetical protein